jgi:hypothetical protein
MANIKISELTALTPPAAADELPVVDVSASATKKTTVGELVGIITGDVEVASNGTATISELPVSKLQDGAARQLLQTDAAGTGVEWASNIDIPGTLDVTSIATFDSIARYPLGSAGAPTITFTGDTNTGIYSPGADQLALTTGGTERLRITSAGLVGVGTSVPGALVDISGSGNIIRLGDGTNTFDVRFKGPNNWATQLDTSADTFSIQRNSTSFVTIDGAGRLGIGITSPSTSLQIGDGTGLRQAYITGNGYDLYLGASGGTAFGLASQAASLVFNNTSVPLAIGTLQSQPLVFGSANFERARIDSSGRLLVGTGSDSGGALFQVNGNRIRVATAKTPASAADTGTAGEICWDADYIYVCTATNTWKRTAISTW